jgi:hypothetical protein
VAPAVDVVVFGDLDLGDASAAEWKLCAGHAAAIRGLDARVAAGQGPSLVGDLINQLGAHNDAHPRSKLELRTDGFGRVAFRARLRGKNFARWAGPLCALWQGATGVDGSGTLNFCGVDGAVLVLDVGGGVASMEELRGPEAARVMAHPEYAAIRRGG